MMSFPFFLPKGLFQLLETKVSVRCRKQDVNLVKVIFHLWIVIIQKLNVFSFMMILLLL